MIRSFLKAGFFETGAVKSTVMHSQVAEPWLMCFQVMEVVVFVPVSRFPWPRQKNHCEFIPRKFAEAHPPAHCHLNA